MKFTVERAAFMKMMRPVGLRAPDRARKDADIRVAACEARVFLEANDCIGGVEALVLEQGTFVINYQVLLRLIKGYPQKKNLIFSATETQLLLFGSARPVKCFSRSVLPPADFKVFPVTDGWLASADDRRPGELPKSRWLDTTWWE